MHWTRPLRYSLLAVLLGLLSLPTSPGQANGKNTLEPVSYAELGRLVRSLRGKVVVVYFWADY